MLESSDHGRDRDGQVAGGDAVAEIGR